VPTVLRAHKTLAPPSTDNSFCRTPSIDLKYHKYVGTVLAGTSHVPSCLTSSARTTQLPAPPIFGTWIASLALSHPAIAVNPVFDTFIFAHRKLQRGHPFAKE
jgi:hypothetical protein